MNNYLFASIILFGIVNLAEAQETKPADQHAGHAMPISKEGDAMADMPGMKMHGMYGLYSMTREASGTSWQPDSTPHEGIHNMGETWMTMAHGFAYLVHDKQGGPRGDSKTFSASMGMLMGQRELGPGTLGLRAMLSLDPLMGKAGYPLLFQTGETADGVNPLIDRQHPHDLFMELAASYSVPLNKDSSVFFYGGFPGEPALGPPAFMHRTSGVDNPEAPITHHWLDSTHVTFGVLTTGYQWKNLRLEVSGFHGREPDQLRYNFDHGKLDSASTRLSYNPTENWALQLSHGFIKSAEQLTPDESVHRTTASVSHNQRLPGGNWQTTFAWGRNAHADHTLDAYLLESAYHFNQHTVFGRLERAAKDELFLESAPQAGQTFKVSKLSAGYVFDFPLWQRVKFGVGGLVSAYGIPKDLEASYGSNPNSWMVFGRVKIQ
jgi:hypothetical protein